MLVRRVLDSMSISFQGHIILFYSLPTNLVHLSVTHAPTDNIYYKKMSSPYQPPSVETFFDSCSLDGGASEAGASSGLTYIESNQERDYLFYESFYSEPPMTHEEVYPDCKDVYVAREFDKILSDFTQPLSVGDIEAMASSDDLDSSLCLGSGACGPTESINLQEMDVIEESYAQSKNNASVAVKGTVS